VVPELVVLAEMMTDLHEVVMIGLVQAVRGEMTLVQAEAVMIVQVLVDHLLAAQAQIAQVPVAQVPIAQFANDPIDQPLAVREEMMTDHRVVVTIGQVRVGQVRVERVQVGQVQVDQAQIAQVPVDHSANDPIDRLQAVPVEMMIDLHEVVMIGQVQVGQALVVRTALVMIDPREIVTTDQVPVGQVQVDRFVAVMIVQIVVVMIAAMSQRVHKLPRNVKPTRFITVRVVASTAKNRCQLPSTQSSVGKMTVQ